MICTYTDCRGDATKVIAVPAMRVPCVAVNAYCDEHAAGVMEIGGQFAAGTALSAEAQEIEGIRR
jgi:hypothetical protein